MALKFLEIVLGLAGLESIFFTVAVMGIDFRFVLKIWRPKYGLDNMKIFFLLLSGACTDPRSILLLTLPHQEGGIGVHKELGEYTARTADPN